MSDLPEEANLQSSPLTQADEASLALRQRAEAAYVERGFLNLDELPSSALQRDQLQALLHELQVHQIELELQNEELRRTQLELDTAHSRYFDLYDLAPVGYCTLNEQGLIQEANLTVSMMLGVDRSNLEMRPFASFIYPEDQDSFYLLRKRLQDSSDQQSRELRMLGCNKTTTWMQLTATTAHGDDGQDLVRVVLTNVTPLKQAAIAAQERQRELLLIANNVPGPVLRVDRNLRYLFVNDHNESIFGHRREQVIGRSMPEIIGEKLWEQVAPYAQRALTGEAVTFESEFFTPSGEPKYLLVNFVPDFNHDAIVCGFFVVAIDIGERKRAEASRASLELQLRESQKMEAVGTLAGGIAHDFNNMLTVILGNTELALAQSRSAIAFGGDYLNEIRKAAEKARDLVRQILSFSRKQSVERMAILLSPIVEESGRLLRATLPVRITLAVHCDAQIPHVLADATQIEQVILNLATNAMQAMRGKNGRIDIRLDSAILDETLLRTHPQLRTLHDKHPGTAVRLVVRDDGPGIDPISLKRIFEPFFTTKPVGEGTGLGLAVVHGIVRGHEGLILVESELGAGTTFSIYLPSTQAAIHPAVATPNQNQLIRTEDTIRILYVDDDASVLRSMTHMLNQQGYRVTGFTNQQEALETIRVSADQFDVVVTDYNMPGMSGLEIARSVRALRVDLPVAITSGFIDEELRCQAAKAGVQELISKPFGLQTFDSSIRRLTRTEPAPPFFVPHT